MSAALATLLGAVEKPAGGAPTTDLIIVACGTTLLTLLTLQMIVAYRRGGARPLRRLLDALESRLGLPGWAALPGLGAIAFSVVTIWGASWDIGLHIDQGRDEGPLGTAAHYPMLIGLFGTFLMGILSVGLAPTDRRKSSPVAFYVPGVGTVPAAGLLLLAASSFAMAGFPLDDLWHRIFGQDVTLWGPTHTMFIGGVMAAGCGATLLLAEGSRTAGREPFGGGSFKRLQIPALLAGIFLYLWTAALHEFNWGVPQYREIWQPMMLAFGGAHAMVLARLIAGRGGAFAALLTWLPMQVAMVLVIGGPLDTTMPSMPLFIAEALIIELLAVRGEWRSPVRFGAVAGLGVGTIGFAANYGWSHLAMPLPWPAAILPEAIPVAIAAGVAGGLLGALMAQALRGELPSGRMPLALASAAALVAIGLGINAAVVDSPRGVTATIALSNLHQATVPGGGTGPVADATVRLSDPSLAEDATWTSVMAWQGGGRFLNALERGPDGTLRTTEPIPIGGSWKSLVRIHKGRTMLAAPVRMPADAAVGFAGYPAEPQVTREMTRDTTLLQLERRDDAPLWAWTPATILVLTMDILLMVLLALISVRIGRMSGREGAVEASGEGAGRHPVKPRPIPA